MKRHVLGSIVLMISFAVGQSISPRGEYYMGKAEAYFDLWQGRLRLKRCITATYSRKFPVKRFDDYLRVAYGVETIYVDPCIPDEPSRERFWGYNSVQLLAVDDMIGPDVMVKLLSQFRQEAQRELEAEDHWRRRLLFY